MAKFCGKCGSALNEDGLCPNCEWKSSEYKDAQVDSNQNVSSQSDLNQNSQFQNGSHQNDPTQNYMYQNDIYEGDSYYDQAYQNANPQSQNQTHSRSFLKGVILLIFIILCFGVGAFALNYFHVVEIPVISDMVDRIQEHDDNEEGDAAESFAKDDIEDAEDTDAPDEDEAEAHTTAPASTKVQTMTLSGYLDSETYISGNNTGNIAVLYLDEEMDFDVFPPYDSIYGDSVSSSEIQLLGNNPIRYCGNNVTVTGELIFASSEQHRKTVLLQNCKITVLQSEPESKNEVDDSDNNNIGQRFTIRLDDAAGSNAKLNIRSGPGFDYDVITKIRTGTTVTLLDQQNGWSYIDYGSGEGWCSTYVAGLPGSDSINNTIRISSSEASDYQTNGSYNRRYTPNMAVDNDSNTCWMARTDEAGAGSWIRLKFDSEQTVHGIKLLNGNSWNGMYNGEKVSASPFKNNGRIKDFTLSVSDGSYQVFTAKDVQEDDFGANIFYFDDPMETDYIELYVDSTYVGSKYPEVVCLSEIAVF